MTETKQGHCSHCGRWLPLSHKERRGRFCNASCSRAARLARAEPCFTEGCEKPSESLGLCMAHYYRQHRSSTILPTKKGRKGKGIAYGTKVGSLMVKFRSGGMYLVECPHEDGSVYAGLVSAQALRGGNRKTCGDLTHHEGTRAGGRRAVVTYTSIHRRLRRARGRANMFPCTDCGEPAKDWSYSGRCGDEQRSAHKASKGSPFCPHEEHYVPRCSGCHSRYDHEMRRAAMEGSADVEAA